MTQLPDTITEAGQREASVMLARLMGLAPQLFSDVCNFYHEDTYDIFVSIYPHGWYHGMTKDEAWKYFPNLYAPANMALAWKVMNFAAENVPYFSKWWHDIAVVTIQDLPPAALSIFLCDNILRLADEAGMVEVNQ